MQTPLDCLNSIDITFAWQLQLYGDHTVEQQSKIHIGQTKGLFLLLHQERDRALDVRNSKILYILIYYIYLFGYDKSNHLANQLATYHTHCNTHPNIFFCLPFSFLLWLLIKHLWTMAMAPKCIKQSLEFIISKITELHMYRLSYKVPAGLTMWLQYELSHACTQYAHIYSINTQYGRP